MTDQERPRQGLRFSRVVVELVGGESTQLPDLGYDIFRAASAGFVHANAAAQRSLGGIEATLVVEAIGAA